MSILSHSIPLRSIWILFSHLLLGFHSSIFPSGFPTKIIYVFIFPPTRLLHALPILASLTWSF
jgi:hypothetical protein